ncbi:lipoprotein intramolecular transacylase Lit, partial [Clostridioides difficile]
KILKTTSITLIIMPLLLTVPILLNFEKSFIIFHKLLFRNDYWASIMYIPALLFNRDTFILEKKKKSK